MRLRGIAYSTACALLVACAAITGASDLRVEGDGGARDAGADAPPPPPEDSGSSLVSCGDQRVCLSAPSGWTPVVLVEGAANTLCPSTYAQKTAAKGVDSVATCSCTCGGAAGPGSCDGDLRLDWGNGQCSVQATNLTVSPDGGCAPVALGPVDNGVKASFLAATPCAPKITQQIPQPVDVAICAGAEVTTSPLCRDGESCVPQVARGQRLCIARDGEVPCPSGAWTRWSTGQNPSDTRACSACTCATNIEECARGQLLFYAADGCAGQPISTVTTDDTCRATSANGGEPRAVVYKPGAGCSIAQEPTLTGALAFGAAKTVCCVN